MKLNKVLQGTLVVAAAAATWVGAGTGAAAKSAEMGGATVEVDPENQVLEVTGGEDSQEILFAVVKPNKKGEVKVSSWDVYEKGEAVTKIDLSGLNNAKDNYIAVMTDDAKAPGFIKIPAAQSAAVEFDGSLDTPELKVGFGAKPKDAKGAAKTTTGFEYRTALGSWIAVDAKPTATEDEDEEKGKDTTSSALPDWTVYQQQGAVLYFRAPGASKDAAELTKSNNKLKLAGADDSAATEVYESKALPGKEVKFKIAKRANGPSVSADYVKGTVKLPKNSVYRVVGDTIGGVTQNAEAKSVAVEEFFKKEVNKEMETLAEGDGDGVTGDDNNEDGNETAVACVTIEVRTAANNEKKKPASKWSRIVVEQPTDFGKALTVAAALDKKDGDTKDDVVSYGGAGVANSTIKEDGKDLIKVDYVETGKGDKKAYTDVKVTNNSDYIFEIIVQETDTTPAADAKVTAKVKAKGGIATLKKVADGRHIFIRKAGDKKTQTWVGKYQKLGVVDYPKTAEADKTTTPSEKDDNE